MRNNFQIWVDAVCEQVRFQPDRKGIARELRTHYEDHVNDLLRLGRDRELAEERALAAMGNAQEVGRALDRVHKPWLGWLWEASRFLVLALAVLLAWKTGNADYYTLSLTDRTWDQLTWSAPSAASRAATDYLDLWLVPGEPEPYCDPYTEAPAPGETRVQVPLTLWVETRDVFHYDLAGLYDGLHVAADGRSLHWGSYLEDDSQLDSGYWTFQRSGDHQTGWTRYRDGLLLVLDNPPRRVEITHSRCDWTLTAEWEGAS